MAPRRYPENPALSTSDYPRGREPILAPVRASEGAPAVPLHRKRGAHRALCDTDGRDRTDLKTDGKTSEHKINCFLSMRAAQISIAMGVQWPQSANVIFLFPYFFHHYKNNVHFIQYFSYILYCTGFKIFSVQTPDNRRQSTA